MTDDLVKRLRGRFELCNEAADLLEKLQALVESLRPSRRWELGDLVKKKSGAEWRGCIVGFYSTDLTPIGYCVASAFEENSVQIYPESALEDWND